MKKIILVLLFTITFFSCKKQEELNPVLQSGKVKAIIKSMTETATGDYWEGKPIYKINIEDSVSIFNYNNVQIYGGYSLYDGLTKIEYEIIFDYVDVLWFKPQGSNVWRYIGTFKDSWDVQYPVSGTALYASNLDSSILEDEDFVIQFKFFRGLQASYEYSFYAPFNVALPNGTFKMYHYREYTKK